MMPRSAGREAGQIAVLTVGFMLVLGLLAVVVINSSEAFIAGRNLDNLADGAAIAAADGLAVALLYDDGQVELSHREASAAVRDYVDGHDVVVAGVRVNGSSVEVHLRRTITLTFNPPGWPRRTTIASTARATLQDFGAFG